MNHSMDQCNNGNGLPSGSLRKSEEAMDRQIENQNSETSTSHNQDSRVADWTQAAIDRLLSVPILSAKQEKMTKLLLQTRPLTGLKSGATPAFVEYLQKHVQPKIDEERMKLSIFDVDSLQIGSWRVEGPNKIVAKFFFCLRRMMWEIFEEGMKKKIQVEWDYISAMRFYTDENEYEFLELELDGEASFFQELNPGPEKHVVNEVASDFTGGQAMIFRIHTLRCRPGTLLKHYERLVRQEPRFLHLVQNAKFPSLQDPFFDWVTEDVRLKYSFGCNGNSSQINSTHQPFISNSTEFHNVGRHSSSGWNQNNPQINSVQQGHCSSTQMPLHHVQAQSHQLHQTLRSQASIPPNNNVFLASDVYQRQFPNPSGMTSHEYPINPRENNNLPVSYNGEIRNNPLENYESQFFSWE